MLDQDLAALWRRRLDDIVASDLTVEQWCEQHGVTARQYGYWRKRLNYKRPKQRIPPRQWAEVSLVEPTAESAVQPSTLTLRIGGAEIDLAPGFDAVLLRAIVEALRAPEPSAPC